MAIESFLGGKIELHCGDCLDVLPTLAENSVDSCVTDPPYHLTSIVKRFGSPTAKPVRVPDINAVNCIKAAHARAAAGFMGKQWDGGDIAFRPDVWREVYRVLKPGAHLLAFGGTRTYHRMVCAIEDAGFEVRDCIMWVYGQGFPKSHDVSRGIDRAFGIKGKYGDFKSAQHKTQKNWANDSCHEGWQRPWKEDLDATERLRRKYIGGTDAARQWKGWGTALKPACEPIVLARKPLSEGTVAANVLRWGTGAINVDGCRVPTESPRPHIECRNDKSLDGDVYGSGINGSRKLGTTSNSRWPANLIHDGSEEVVAGFPESISPSTYHRNVEVKGGNIYTGGGVGKKSVGEFGGGIGDSGSAARFFYTAKADSDDRLGSKHPTVKPIDLMQYLVRLVTPKGGIVLDPFAGTGTTGEAAWREGMCAVLIEREAEYQADICRRMALALSGPDERARQAIKERMKDKPTDDGPLFDWISPDASPPQPIA